MSSEPPQEIRIMIDNKCYEIRRKGDLAITFEEDNIHMVTVHKLTPKSWEIGREALLKIIDSIQDAYAQMVQYVVGRRGDP